jgi:succinate dehydrogenase / fumarate reductase cytochrome b subunit
MHTNSRPVYLNLFKIKLPIAGIMSIIHRVSGVLMTFAIPLLIYLLAMSLSDAQQFDQLKTLILSWPGQLLLFCAYWALLHHLFAGVRYLLLDIDIGIDKPWYGYSAWAVMFAAPLAAALLLGVM